jgi:hypothetical protein
MVYVVKNTSRGQGMNLISNHRKKMKAIMVGACALLVQPFMSQTAFAWNQMGHLVIAQIAYDQLTPAMQKQVSQMTSVLGNYFPSTASFVSAASWADEIKGNGVKAFNNWHFINQRFSYVRMKMPDYIQRENVVWAVQQSQDVLQSDKANDFERSVFLRFLIHFTGDAHQPTQCSNFYSWQFKEGDNGGVGFPIQGEVAKNLHQFWDNGLGSLVLPNNAEPTGNDIKQYAKNLETKYPASFFGPQVEQVDPAAWARESLRMAQTFVYKEIKPWTQPSDNYITQGKDMVDQRLTIAGYRLANLLNMIMADKAEPQAKAQDKVQETIEDKPQEITSAS